MTAEIIAFHAKRYPLMQPQDAVKLLYQQAFGVGHLIADKRTFYERLIREMESTEIVPDIPLSEPIGNGLVRVMLASPEIARISAEELTAACIRTAAEPLDSMETFSEKLAVLEGCCRQGMFAFTPAELSAYLTAYRAAGFPAVSHSEIYRQAYHPAYRVVKEAFRPLCDSDH